MSPNWRPERSLSPPSDLFCNYLSGLFSQGVWVMRFLSPDGTFVLFVWSTSLAVDIELIINRV